MLPVLLRFLAKTKHLFSLFHRTTKKQCMFCEVFWWCINPKSTNFTVSGYRQDLEKADLVNAPPIDPSLTVYLALSHNPSTGAPTALPSKIFHISFRHLDTLIRLSDRAHGVGIAHLCLDYWFPRQPTGASPYWGQMSLAQVLFRLSAPKGDALSYHSLIGTTPCTKSTFGVSCCNIQFWWWHQPFTLISIHCFT